MSKKSRKAETVEMAEPKPAKKPNLIKNITIFLALAVLFSAILMHKLNKVSPLQVAGAPLSNLSTSKPAVSHTKTEEGELLSTTIIDVELDKAETASITVLSKQPSAIVETKKTASQSEPEKIIEATSVVQAQKMAALKIKPTPKVQLFNMLALYKAFQIKSPAWEIMLANALQVTTLGQQKTLQVLKSSVGTDGIVAKADILKAIPVNSNKPTTPVDLPKWWHQTIGKFVKIDKINPANNQLVPITELLNQGETATVMQMLNSKPYLGNTAYNNLRKKLYAHLVQSTVWAELLQAGGNK